MKTRLQSVIVASLAFGALSVGAESANAVIQDSACKFTGDIVGYGYPGEGAGDHVTDPSNTIGEYVCKTNDMRIYKAKADTAHEVLALVNMAEHDAKAKYPIAVCETGPDAAYVVDLAYFYTPIKKINKAERDNYKTFVMRYAKNHSCKIYR